MVMCVAVRVYGNRLLKRLMWLSPKSQVMFASAFSWIGDLVVFLAFIFFMLLPLCWIYMNMHAIRYIGQCDVNIPNLSPRASRSKAIANDYRYEYHHGCALWTLVLLMQIALFLSATIYRCWHHCGLVNSAIQVLTSLCLPKLYQ